MIEVDATGPDGVGLDFMDRELDEIEVVLIAPYLESGEIQSTFSIVGRYDPNRVRVTAQLADWSERDRSQTAIVEELNDPLREIPGSRTNARGRGTRRAFGGGGDGIEVALTGGEYPTFSSRRSRLRGDRYPFAKSSPIPTSPTSRPSRSSRCRSIASALRTSGSISTMLPRRCAR